MKSGATTGESTLALNAAEERIRVQKLSRRSEKAAVEEKGKGGKGTVQDDTSSQTNTGLCTETKTLALSIKEQRKQQLSCRLNSLTRSKRQISLATNNQMVINLVFPDLLDLALLEANYNHCQDLLPEAKKYLSKSDGAKRLKGNLEFRQNLNKFKVIIIEKTTTHKVI